MLNNDSLQQLKELKIALEEQKQVCEGVVKGTQHRYGFLVIDNKRQLFLPPEEMQKVFPEDTIRVIVRKDKKGKEYGEVEKVVSSSLDEFVGRYVIKGKAHFVEPDISHLSRWIFIPPSNRENAESGDYVRCQILRHPLKTGKAQAKILQVLGNDQTIGIEALFTINKYGLPDSWPEEGWSISR
jgi:ribonuclease R